LEDEHLVSILLQDHNSPFFTVSSGLQHGLVVLPSRQGSRQDFRLVLSFRVVKVFSLVFPANTVLFR
jgi:hypothetical protein